jgi:hypothetical protein
MSFAEANCPALRRQKCGQEGHPARYEGKAAQALHKPETVCGEPYLDGVVVLPEVLGGLLHTTESSF